MTAVISEDLFFPGDGARDMTPVMATGAGRW